MGFVDFSDIRFCSFFDLFFFNTGLVLNCEEFLFLFVLPPVLMCSFFESYILTLLCTLLLRESSQLIPLQTCPTFWVIIPNVCESLLPVFKFGPASSA